MRQLVVDLGLKASAESAARLDQAAAQKLLLDARRRARAATQLQQQQQQQRLGQGQGLGQGQDQGQAQGQGWEQVQVRGPGQALACGVKDHAREASYRGSGLNSNSDDPGPAGPDSAPVATVPSVHGVPRHHPWAPPPLEEAWEVLSQALGRCGVQQLNTRSRGGTGAWGTRKCGHDPRLPCSLHVHLPRNFCVVCGHTTSNISTAADLSFDQKERKNFA